MIGNNQRETESGASTPPQLQIPELALALRSKNASNERTADLSTTLRSGRDDKGESGASSDGGF
jgi:hypothetical protein